MKIGAARVVLLWTIFLTPIACPGASVLQKQRKRLDLGRRGMTEMSRRRLNARLQDLTGHYGRCVAIVLTDDVS
jgi:hypothetical protein